MLCEDFGNAGDYAPIGVVQPLFGALAVLLVLVFEVLLSRLSGRYRRFDFHPLGAGYVGCACG